MTSSSCRSILSTAVVALLASTSDAAAFLNEPVAHPSLGAMAEVQAGTALRIRLDIATNDKYKSKPDQRLAFNGPAVEFLNNPVHSTSNGDDLLNAVFAKLSTGGKQMKVIEPGSFIGLDGQEVIHFEGDHWEMAWREDRHNGKLLCVFDLPLPVHRGDAKLDAGKLYIDFDAYSEESLAAELELKNRVLEQNKVHMAEKDAEMDKMRKTNNPIMKMWHYRNAFAAVENIYMAPQVEQIPDDSDVIQLPNGLRLSKEGRVFRKTGEMPLLGPKWEKLGKVYLSEYAMKPKDEPTTSTRKHYQGEGMYDPSKLMP